MPGSFLSSRSSSVTSLALGIGLVGLVGLMFFLPRGLEAQGTEGPRATAGYHKGDQLRLSVAVPAGDAARDLIVELLDARRTVVGSTQQKLPAGPATNASFTFGRLKVEPGALTVRSRLDGRSVEVPLSRILLARGQETALAATTEFHVGGRAELTCKVYGVRSLSESVPLVADVTIELVDGERKARTLFEGKTNEQGLAQPRFQVPAIDAGNYTLRVKTRSTLGEDTLERPVKLVSTPKVLLTSDKPLYQPGQTIHVRALALRAFDLVPARAAALQFEIEDSRGNKVLKAGSKTSDHGIASIDFTLADEVNLGEYRVRALLGEHVSEKTVNVQKYVLPKFKVDLKTNRTYYLPKEKVQGTLQVDYFFGKPVAKARVEVKASTFDVAFREFAVFKGTTNDTGRLEFDITLPDYFVGQPLVGGKALVKLDAKVIDSAEHAETVTRNVPVSDQAIRVTFLPEGGRVVPGVENRVFVAALRPDGTPATCTLVLHAGQEAKGKPLARVKVGENGLGEVRLTPRADQFRVGGHGQRQVELLGGNQTHWGPTNVFDLTAIATDERGNVTRTTTALTSDLLGENVLMRLDKAIYRAGDTVHLEVHSSAGIPTAYVDVVKAGQAMLTRWLDVKDGKAATAIDLPPEVFGTIEVHVYQILATGEVVRDARVVYVNPASEVTVKVTPDRPVYRPGDKGVLRFEVTDAKGNPAAAALGVLIVDEAVYAMQEIQPGLEKVFFTLQEELSKPAVQADYKPGERLDTLVRQEDLPAEKQQAAQALLTLVRPKPPVQWLVDPAVERRQKVQGQLQVVGWGLFRYAQQHPDVLVQDKRAGKWAFRSDLLERVIKAGMILPAQLQGPFGEKITLARLSELGRGFTVEKFGVAQTQARMQHLVWGIGQVTNANRAKWFRNGKWNFPEDLLIQVEKGHGFAATVKSDAWGKAFRLVARPRGLKNETGMDQFEGVVLTSAGPDGKFGTADDVLHKPNDPWSMGVVWNWDDKLSGMRDEGRQLGFRGLAPQNQMFLFGGMGGGGGGPMGGPGGVGGPLPMAPRAALADNAVARFAQPAAPPPGPDVGSGKGSGAPITRLREYFPETLLWQPALLTDDRGRATLEVPFADSITTWRLTASASTRGGRLGGTTIPLRVFQDFFVDLDLPVALTQNDEVSFPVAIYNYLQNPQTIRVELKKEPWFELIDSAGATREVRLGKGEVSAVRFRIRARKVGTFPLTVEARGSKVSDAIKRSIEIEPDGKAFEQVFTDRLEGTIGHEIQIPPTAIDGASRLYMKVYPGVISQVVEGLEGMLRMPTGCFEQTSSSAYPNILVVDYLKRSRMASPALMARSEQFLSAGYQRLLTFERPGGGFDWWGSGEPLVWLSAYGLREFSQMARVYPIDRGIIDRTRAWLLKQQGPDGTWANIGATHGESIERMGDPKLLLTSYVTWALLDSMPKPEGWRKRPETAPLAKAIAYIREQAPRASNAYILALAANALAAWDATDDSTFAVLKRVLSKLEEKRQRKADWNAAFYVAEGQSLAYGRDDSLTVETTALTCLAMLKSGQFTTSVNQALTYLVKTKSASGHWGSTQATILALEALLTGLGGVEHKGTTPFAILVNGKRVASGEVTRKNADVLQQFDLTPHLGVGETRVALEVKGETSLMYQVAARHFEPRKKEAPVKPVLAVEMEFDRTRLSTSDLLKATATLRYQGKQPTYNVIVDLPIPPGFTVDGGDFAELVAAKKVQKFSITARQVILYLGDVEPGAERRFVYSLKPKYPIKAKAPAAVAYEYYTPSNRGESRPVTLVVEEK